MPSGTDERSQKRTSGVHRKGWARVYCDSRRKPWLQQGKIASSDEAASGETIGFYYLRARYMNPANGRFTQQDMFSGWENDPPSIHKYAYANNDPLNGADPSGRFTIGEAMQAVGVMANLASAATTGYRIGQFITGEREFNAKEVGITILLGKV